MSTATRADRRAWVGIFGLPRELTAFLHEQEPSRQTGFLGERCAGPVDFDIEDETIEFPLGAPCHPRWISVWHGERLFGLGPAYLGEQDGWSVVTVREVTVVTLNGPG